MRRRNVVFGSLLAAGMLTLGQGAASANMVWCLSDPPLQVVSPGGHTLTVNTTVYVPLHSQLLDSAIVDDAITTPDGSGGTLVTVNVWIPAGVSTARVVSSVNQYKVSAQASGTGGSIVTLHLDVPTS
jgi:hypothetical protein